MNLTTDDQRAGQQGFFYGLEDVADGAPYVERSYGECHGFDRVPYTAASNELHRSRDRDTHCSEFWACAGRNLDDRADERDFQHSFQGRENAREDLPDEIADRVEDRAEEEAGRIGQGQGIVQYIAVAVEALRIAQVLHERIGREEAADLGIV